MHDDVSNEMVAYDIAEFIEESMHMDKEGDICSEKYAFGFKVSHDINHLECFIMADEVGEMFHRKVIGMQEGLDSYVRKGQYLKRSLRTKTTTLTY